MKIEPVSVTDKAVEAVKAIMEAKEVPDEYGLRIGRAAAGASCGSTAYRLGFSKKNENDISYFADDLPVIINKLEVLHLSGLKLDYIQEKDKSGFLFERLPA